MNELNQHELQDVSGGVTPLVFLAGLALAAGTYVIKDIYENWGTFKEGFTDGQNAWK